MAAGLTETYEVQGKRQRLFRHRPTLRIHDLRHSFASHLVSNGVSLELVGKLMGHVRTETTARYSGSGSLEELFFCVDRSFRA